MLTRGIFDEEKKNLILQDLYKFDIRNQSRTLFLKVEIEVLKLLFSQCNWAGYRLYLKRKLLDSQQLYYEN